MARILVVDDDPSTLRAMTRTLTRAGHAVRQAVDGQSALAMAEEGPVDVLVSDYELPDTDGLKVMRHLRDRWPSSARILVSGALDVDITIDAVNGADAVRILAKPFAPDHLIRVVDEALAIQAAQRTQPTSEYDGALVREAAALDLCLTSDYLSLAVQPIVSSVDRRPVAWECLIRSSHPLLDGPWPLLQAAERHGRLPELGARVASMAAELISSLPPRDLVFVNVHPVELADPEGLRQAMAPLVPHAGRVVLEITERASATDMDEWAVSTAALTDMGFALAVDDVGAGYSSLSVLAAIAPRFLKVDMSLVRGVDTDPRKRRLIELLCTFASGADSVVVAEGIETEAEARAVIACGATLLQGYLFGRPHVLMPGHPNAVAAA